MRRRGGRRALLSLALLFWSGAAACAPHQWDDVVDDRASSDLMVSLNRAAPSHPEFPGVRLRSMTPFAWDGLFAFRQGDSGKNVRTSTGLTFMPDGEYVDEHHVLLVFTRRAKAAKILMLDQDLRRPLDYTSGEKYGPDTSLIDPEGRGIMRLTNPGRFQRLFDPAIEGATRNKARTLRNKEAAALGDLGFVWDRMRVIAPSDLPKETGITYPRDLYHPVLANFMVFSRHGDVVRIGEMSFLQFSEETQKKWHGRSWSAQVRLARDDHGVLDLREP